MTTQGLGDPIPSRTRLAAYRACGLTGSVCSKAIPDNPEMETLPTLVKTTAQVTAISSLTAPNGSLICT